MLNKENNFGFIKSGNSSSKYNKSMQAMESIAKPQAVEKIIKQPNKIKEGDGKMEPMTPYNFETLIDTEHKQEK